MITLTSVNKVIEFKVQNKSVLLTAQSNEVVFQIVSSYGENAYIPKNVINAKGDLIVGNEEAEPMRFPIGAPNYFMIVDPTQDRGFKYTNVVDGGSF